MSKQREYDTKRSLGAFEDPESAGECRCSLCAQTHKDQRVFVIMEAVTRMPDGSYEDFVIPKAFVCGKCANSTEQALTKWKTEKQYNARKRS